MQPKSILQIKSILDKVVDQVNHLSFIENDPISIPHSYTKLQDIEVAAFFSATLAWGQRKTIINKTKELMNLMDNQPHHFIVNHKPTDLKPFLHFKHRTFQSTDLLYFISFLQEYYLHNKSLEQAFYPDHRQAYNQKKALTDFYNLFFNSENAPDRTKKHISTPAKNSACKRMNMFLRWMVRTDRQKVDFGLWKTIPTSELMIPLDVHVEKYARNFGILTRKQRDWHAVEEITSILKLMNPTDPIIYDYALFGLGVLNKNLNL
jgi:uncharacterized protein (TIGR02757 family)